MDTRSAVIVSVRAESVALRARALAMSRAQSRFDRALTTPTSSRPSVGDASGKACTPPTIVPTLAMITQLASPLYQGSPSTSISACAGLTSMLLMPAHT